MRTGAKREQRKDRIHLRRYTTGQAQPDRVHRTWAWAHCSLIGHCVIASSVILPPLTRHPCPGPGQRCPVRGHPPPARQDHHGPSQEPTPDPRAIRPLAPRWPEAAAGRLVRRFQDHRGANGRRRGAAVDEDEASCMLMVHRRLDPAPKASRDDKAIAFIASAGGDPEPGPGHFSPRVTA